MHACIYKRPRASSGTIASRIAGVDRGLGPPSLGFGDQALDLELQLEGEVVEGAQGPRKKSKEG